MQFQFFYKIIVNETYLQIFDYTKSVNKNADNLTAWSPTNSLYTNSKRKFRKDWTIKHKHK